MTLEALLLPIAEHEPCGEDLSFSAAFDEIAELRREDDPTLDQGEWVTALKLANWPAVHARCAELLTQRSKDLRLAMWFAEAAALSQGYPGLRQGLQLCTELCDQYWPGLHPQPEDGDMEQRVGNVGWFLTRVTQLVLACAITKGPAGSFSLHQWQLAKSQGSGPRGADKSEAPSGVGSALEQVQRALKETPKEFLRQAAAGAADCCVALDAWQAVIDSKLGHDSPSFAKAREALGGAAHEVQRLAREAGALSADAMDPATLPVADASARPTTAGCEPAASSAGGPLQTREQALAQLREVASFFRMTEPHSPVAYLADKAVRWGEMPLHVWLRAVVKDAGALAHLEEALGIDPSRDANGGDLG